jgi:predicted unusual protein kinase regulating ubiquinone biosynthesis (AarF/ABC1/UbiB family)
MARQATWSVAEFARCEAEVQRRLDVVAGDERQKLAFLLSEQARVEGESGDQMLMAVAANILALELHGRFGGLSTTDARRVHQDAVLLLRTNGIKPGTSRLSFLYGRLVKALGEGLRRRGHLLPAICRVEVARHLTYRPTDEVAFDDAMSAAEMHLRLGNASLAIVNSSAAAGLARSIDESKRAGLVKVQALRLTGAATAAAEAMHAVELLGGDAAPEFAWERVAGSMADPETAGAAAMRIFRERNMPLFVNLMTKLSLFAGRNRTTRLAAPKAVNLRRRQGVSERELADDRQLFGTIVGLDEAYDSVIPLADRLTKIGDLLDERSSLPTIEAELLLLAAAYRHALHFMQPDLAQIYLAEYRGVCWRLTSGAQSDLLRLAEHRDQSAAAAAPRGLARASKVVAAAGKMAGIAAAGKVRRWLAAEAEQQRLADRELHALGECLVDQLSVLKGGLMKVGQYFSMIDGLPPELRTMLALLRHSASAVSPLAVERELADALGDPAATFSDWESDPIAVASIGQIHRARLARDGTLVAVKVRHPGMRDAILTDLRVLNILQPVLQRRMPATDMTAMLAELADRLRDETDFTKEAASQEAFRQAFADDPDVLVPKVFAEASTDAVLTMEFVEGRRYEDFLATASQAERDRAGLVIARVFTKALVEHGIFNCDPHPGNYLFLDDGRVAFLDFGCSRSWPRAFVHGMFLDLYEALLADDYAAFVKVVAATGYNKSGKFDSKAHWQLCRTMYEPLLTPGVRALDRDYLERVSRLHVASPNLKTASPPPEGLMLLRVTFGLMNLLVELGARVDWHALARDGFARYSERQAGLAPGVSNF